MNANLAPYFSLGSVMEGLSGLLQNLYDVTLEVEEPLPGELWANDVYKLAGESDGGEICSSCMFLDVRLIEFWLYLWCRGSYYNSSDYVW